VQRTQDKVARGQAATWQVGVWAQNGNAANVTIKLAAAPAGQKGLFSVGCGSQDGTAACGLGTVFSSSSERQVLAKIAVPATATTVTSVKLAASLTAANLVKSPTASVDIAVVAPGTPGTTGATNTTGGLGSAAGALGSAGLGTTTSQLPVGSLPTIAGPGGTSLAPGGNAAGLFPTVNPSAVPSPAPNSASGVVARQVGNTDAMPIGTPVIDAQLAGLGALGVAFLLAVTRLSVRKRPLAASGSVAAAATTSGPKDPGTPATPEPPEHEQA
jgi:hypothetical protein